MKPGVVCFFLLIGFGGAATAQQVEIFAHTAQVIVPQRRSFTVRSSQQPVRIESVRARVNILEQAATTTLEVALFNPMARPTEAILLLPVPDGAAVTEFAFEGAAREPTARLLPKAEARRIYDSIVRKLRDPALLEFAGYNLVKTSVFPVPASGRQKVRLTYHHLLAAAGDRVDYVLPRSEALDVTVPWDVSVDIKAKSPISTVYSPSHEFLTARQDARHVSLRIREDARAEPGAFRLSYLLQRDGVTGSLFAYPDPKTGGGYFLLLAGLPATKPEGTVRREVTLVLDRSGSMAGGKLDQVKAAALQVIEGLADGEAFNIIDYSNTVAMLAPGPVRRDTDSLARARTYLASLRPNGGTNIHDALVEALRQRPTPGMLPIVLFLTDGLPTIGQTSEGVIRAAVEKGNPHRRRVFTFGVGHDVNAPLLDRIADVTRAATTYVDPGEDVEVKVAQVFQRLYGPVLADTRVVTLDAAGDQVTGVVRELIPARLPDLFEGDQLVLLGQYRGEGPLRFRLEGNYLGRPRAFRLEFTLSQATTKNAFVPRLWASRRIAFLIDQIRQAGGSQPGRPARVGETILNDPKYRELVDEILRLSTEFGVLSEYTAFLAREGTDLSDWDKINLLCGIELDAKAVKRRWGADAVTRSKNLNFGKLQSKQNLRNGYLDDKLGRVQIAGVQSCNDRALFKRGKQWIDGRLIAQLTAVEPDAVVTFGTPEFGALLDALVAEGRQGMLALNGEILLRVGGRVVLVINEIEPK